MSRAGIGPRRGGRADYLWPQIAQITQILFKSTKGNLRNLRNLRLTIC